MIIVRGGQSCLEWKKAEWSNILSPIRMNGNCFECFKALQLQDLAPASESKYPIVYLFCLGMDDISQLTDPFFSPQSVVLLIGFSV